MLVMMLVVPFLCRDLCNCNLLLSYIRVFSQSIQSCQKWQYWHDSILQQQKITFSGARPHKSYSGWTFCILTMKEGSDHPKNTLNKFQVKIDGIKEKSLNKDPFWANLYLCGKVKCCIHMCGKCLPHPTTRSATFQSCGQWRR